MPGEAASRFLLLAMGAEALLLIWEKRVLSIDMTPEPSIRSMIIGAFAVSDRTEARISLASAHNSHKESMKATRV